MTKTYDRGYFDRWYRDPAIGGRARLARKAALAVATAEYHIERPLRTVLDIGCGEGAWRAPLLKLRPEIEYLGFDSSEYAIGRYGRRRNLHLARFGDFAQLRPCAPVDLLVCSDVLHYLSARELDRGLPGLAELCGGVAFLEAFTREDGIVGDTHGFKRRPASFYRQRFAAAGFTPLGSHLWLSPYLREGLAALESLQEPASWQARQPRPAAPGARDARRARLKSPPDTCNGAGVTLSKEPP
jgi:SAM-dependent methyltransferase